MKKLLSILLSLCLICTLIGSTIVPAQAAGSIHISISPSSGTVKRGDTVTFTVSVSGSAEVTQYGLQLSYDTSVFEMVDGACTVSGAQLPDFTPSRGFAVLYSSATVPSGTVGWFTLRVKDSASFSSFSVSGSAAAKNGAEVVSANASGTSVTVVCGHSYDNWTQVDGTNHKHTCSICGKEETLAHTWDSGKTTTPATCLAGGEALFTCTGCGITKTEPIPVAGHNYSSWTRVDDSRHTHTCSVCSKEETASHTWDRGTTVKAANCTSDGEMRYTCTGCRATRTETVPMTPNIHTYDHGCDNDCNVCGDTRTTAHTFTNELTGDKTGHWYECSNCGSKSNVTAHKPGPAPTEDTPQTCTECDYILKPSLNHEHVYADKLTGDDSGHWYACNQCDSQKDFAAHDFDNDCDMLCDTCRYKRTVEHKWGQNWSGDANTHWYECSECQKKNEEAAHDWHRGVCTVCAAEDPNYEPFTLPFWLWLIIGFILGCGFTSLLFLLLRKRDKDDKNDGPPSGGKPESQSSVEILKPAEVAEPAPVTPARKAKPIAPITPTPIQPTPVKPETAAADSVTVEEISVESLLAEFSPSRNKAEPTKAEPVKAEPAKAEPAKAEPVKSKVGVMPNPLKAKPVVADPDSSEAMFKAEPAKAEPVKAEPVKPKVGVMPNPLKAKPVVADPDSTEAMFKAEPAKAEPVKAEPVKPKTGGVMPNPLKAKPVMDDPDSTEAMFKAEPAKAEPVKAEPVKPKTGGVMPNPLKAKPVMDDPDSTEAMFKAAPLMSTPGKAKATAPVTPKPKAAPSAPIASAPETTGTTDPDADVSSEVQIISHWKPF